MPSIEKMQTTNSNVFFDLIVIDERKNIILKMNRGHLNIR